MVLSFLYHSMVLSFFIPFHGFIFAIPFHGFIFTIPFRGFIFPIPFQRFIFPIPFQRFIFLYQSGILEISMEHLETLFLKDQVKTAPAFFSLTPDELYFTNRYFSSREPHDKTEKSKQSTSEASETHNICAHLPLHRLQHAVTEYKHKNTGHMVISSGLRSVGGGVDKAVVPPILVL